MTLRAALAGAGQQPAAGQSDTGGGAAELVVGEGLSEQPGAKLVDQSRVGAGMEVAAGAGLAVAADRAVPEKRLAQRHQPVLVLDQGVVLGCRRRRRLQSAQGAERQLDLHLLPPAGDRQDDGRDGREQANRPEAAVETGHWIDPKCRRKRARRQSV